MGKQICPFMSAGGRKVKCIEHDCMMWTQVMGTHPQTGEQVNQWSCALVWLPTLVLDVSQRVRSVAAATESFRNEMVKASQQPIVLAIPTKQEREVRKIADGDA